MDIITEDEKEDVLAKSKLMKRYSEDIDRESAYELLSEKLERLEEKEAEEEERESSQRKSKTRSRRRPEKSTFEKIASHSLTKTIMREFTRGLLGILK